MWIPFTIDDILARLYEDEAASYRDVSGEDQIDRLAVILEQTCNRFRGAIRSNPHITEMGTAGTLPEFCIFDAATLGRTALIGLAPVQEGVTDPRRDEYRAAMDMLKALPTMNASAFASDPTAPAAASANYGGVEKLDF